jgi:hypothetical protein
MSRRWLRAAIALAATCSTSVVIVGAASASDWPPRRAHLEATALAIPGQPGAVIQEQTIRDDETRAGNLKIDGVATSSLTCDGCSAQSVTQQVIYSRGARSLTADNVATAWATTCTGCSGWALSLQVVVARTGDAVAANNRSFSANVTCVQCSTSSLAVQIVIVSPTARRLSRAAHAQLDQLRQQLISQLTTTPPPPAAASRAATPNAAPAPAAGTGNLTATAVKIQSVLSTDLHATSARHDVKVSVK